MGAPALNHRSVRPGRVNVRKNPQEHSWMRGRTKKMPNCIHSWALVLVGRRQSNTDREAVWML